MKRLTVFFIVVAAAISSNAAYLYWQVTDADTAKVSADYNYVTISYKQSGSEGGLTILEAVSKQDAAAGTITTDLSSLKSGSYSIFVELMNYENETWSQVGVTTSDTALSYTASATSGSSFVDTGFSPVTPAVWHGGTIEAPEPASAMMVMFGLSFLALRRRRI